VIPEDDRVDRNV